MPINTTVRSYGIPDLPVEHLRKTGGVQLSRMLSIGAIPSRLGFAGSEDLGGGLQAGGRHREGRISPNR